MKVVVFGGPIHLSFFFIQHQGEIMEINTEKIKQVFEENPIGFMAAAGAVLMGASKLVEAYGNYKGSSAYARDVNRRVRQSKRRKM
jgi:hypothetical protein